MSDVDLVIRNGQLITGEGEVRGDLAVADGSIVALGGSIAGGATEDDCV